MSTESAAVSSNTVPAAPYVVRVLSADSTKKGAAAALAGVLVAAVTEALWPTV